jgi:hypothetical protein
MRLRTPGIRHNICRTANIQHTVLKNQPVVNFSLFHLWSRRLSSKMSSSTSGPPPILTRLSFIFHMWRV